MKKKILSVIVATIAAVTGVFGLTACGGGFDSAKNVTVIVREDGSGTKSAFMEIIGLKGKKDVSGAIIQTGTPAILASVKTNNYAIAYESLGYVTSDVKMLKIDGVEPTLENVKNGTYKIARPLNVVYKSATLERAEVNAFYEFINSADAQTIISAKGYAAVKDDAKAYEVKAGLSGTINVSGSTSLQPLMTDLAKKFESIQSAVKIIVTGGGSGTGYKNAENGVSDFGMISETFVQEKAASCTYCSVAKDGVAVIVNKANPTDEMSLKTLKNIYDVDAGENAIKTWKQVK